MQISWPLLTLQQNKHVNGMQTARAAGNWSHAQQKVVDSFGARSAFLRCPRRCFSQGFWCPGRHFRGPFWRLSDFARSARARTRTARTSYAAPGRASACTVCAWCFPPSRGARARARALAREIFCGAPGTARPRRPRAKTRRGRQRPRRGPLPKALVAPKLGSRAARLANF